MATIKLTKKAINDINKIIVQVIKVYEQEPLIVNGS